MSQRQAAALGVGEATVRRDVRRDDAESAPHRRTPASPPPIDDARAAEKRARAQRNITAGQKAMGHAMLFPEPERGGRGKRTVPRVDSFSKQTLSKARAVLAYSPGRSRSRGCIQGPTGCSRVR